MTKPWEETWHVKWDEDAGAAYVETGDSDDTLCVGDPAKAALLAAAPDLVRVLLTLETTRCARDWCGGCWACGNVVDGCVVEGHHPDCILDAALRKAGVR